MNKKLLFALIAANAFMGASAQQFGNRTLVAPSANYLKSFVFHDMDDDGDIDIVAARSTGSVSSSANEVLWFKNQGSNTFSAKVLISSDYDDVSTVRLLDIDNDGKKDIVVGDRESGVSWIKNMGSGFFGTKQLLPYNSFLSTLEVGDINNDGFDDIIVAELSNDTMTLLRNNGTGGFHPATSFYIAPGGVNIYSFEFADLDMDQKRELIVSTGGTTAKKIIQFELNEDVYVQTNIYTSSSSPSIYQSYLTDMDNDGLVDVVSNGSDCGGYWFKNFGNNVYSTITPISLTGCNNFNFAGPADLDLDGFQDFVFFRYGSINYRKGTGFGELDSTEILITGTPAIVGELNYTEMFDIDSDGDLDMFYITDSEFGWFMNNAAALATPEHAVSKFTLYPNPATSQIRIASANAIDSYKIYESTGKLVANASFPNAITDCNIDLSGLSSGFYFIEIQSGSSREIKKFVKN
ncbi:MAG: T9SS type A sorting domain-containing protein [Flavobacterium sp.]|nr:MAG: T9SS type A sorting domain-containing protein [Flavobacterium sp.]